MAIIYIYPYLPVYYFIIQQSNVDTSMTIICIDIHVQNQYLKIHDFGEIWNDFLKNHSRCLGCSQIKFSMCLSSLLTTYFYYCSPLVFILHTFTDHIFTLCVFQCFNKSRTFLFYFTFFLFI